MESRELLFLGTFTFYYASPSPAASFSATGGPLTKSRDTLQIPMVAPFFGTTFGGFLYDLLLNDGDSPVNTPWIGLKRLVPGALGRSPRGSVSPV